MLYMPSAILCVVVCNFHHGDIIGMAEKSQVDKVCGFLFSVWGKNATRTVDISEEGKGMGLPGHGQ